MRTCKTLPHKIAYVLEIGWGNHIECQYFNEFLRDRATFLPRYSLGSLEKHRSHHSAALAFKEGDIIRLPEAHPIEEIQWEPKLVENRTIQCCLDYLGPAIRQLRDKMDVIKGLKAPMLGLERPLWEIEAPKLGLEATPDPKPSDRKRKSQDSRGSDINANGTESLPVDTSEVKEVAEEYNVLRMKERPFKKQSKTEEFVKRLKKERHFLREREEKIFSEKNASGQGSSNHNAATVEDALSYDERVITDNVDKAKEVLHHIRSTLSRGDKRTVEKKILRKIDRLKQEREEKIKLIEEELEFLLKRYQEVNRDLEKILQKNDCENEAQNALRKNTLSDLLKDIDEIENRFETIQKELSMVQELDLEIKGNRKNKKFKSGKNAKSQDETSQRTMFAKKWVEEHPGMTFLDLFKMKDTEKLRQDSFEFIEIVRQMILIGNGSMQLRDENGNTALHIARYFPGIKVLIEKGRADINAANNLGKTILHLYAAQECNLFVVDTLLYLLANSRIIIDVGDNDGNTPLHLAILYGFKTNPNYVPPIALFFLAFGASKNIPNKEGKTAEELLLKNACNILCCVKSNCRGHTILEVIPNFPSTEMEKNCSKLINIQDSQRYTCLYYAMRYKSSEGIKWLLKRGANPEIPYKATALVDLFETGWLPRAISIIKFLIQENIEINLLSRGESPLSRALRGIGNASLLKGIYELLTVASPMILCQRNADGDTPFHIFMQNFFKMQTKKPTIKKIQKEMLSIFLRKSASCLLVQNNDLNTPFHVVYSSMLTSIEKGIESMERRKLVYESNCEFDRKSLENYYNDEINYDQQFDELLRDNNLTLPLNMKNKQEESIEDIKRLIPIALEKFCIMKRAFIQAKEQYHERQEKYNLVTTLPSNTQAHVSSNSLTALPDAELGSEQWSFDDVVTPEEVPLLPSSLGCTQAKPQLLNVFMPGYLALPLPSCEASCASHNASEFDDDSESSVLDSSESEHSEDEAPEGWEHLYTNSKYGF